jgi:hypothetical protein
MSKKHCVFYSFEIFFIRTTFIVICDRDLIYGLADRIFCLKDRNAKRKHPVLEKIQNGVHHYEDIPHNPIFRLIDGQGRELLSQRYLQFLKTLQGTLQIFDNICGQFVRLRQIIQICKGFMLLQLR